MRVFLVILTALCFVAGAATLLSSQTVFGEIQGLVLLLIAAVFLCGAGILEGLREQGKNLERLAATLEKIATSGDDRWDVVRKTCETVGTQFGPPPLPGKERYYVNISNSIEGPYSIDRLRELASKGRFPNDTLVLRQGTKAWEPFSNIQ